jgi:signal transduction histidine kinase
VDAVAGGLVALWATIELMLAEGSATEHLAAAAIAIAIGAAVALRRVAPLGSVALAWAAGAASNALPDTLANASVALFLALLYVMYSMALYTDGRRLRIGIAIGLAGVAAVLLTIDVTSEDVLFLPLLTVLAPVAGGQLLQSRLRLNAALRDKAHRLEREREARAEEAVERERARIAGELHDVIAHALGAMTVQAAAARRLAARDTDRAAGAFEAIEGTGREALTELRRLLGVLRREDADAALEPQPTLAYIEELVRRMQAAGLPVSFSVEGTPCCEVPPGIDLTAYRLVQEALGEALRSGGAGHADVAVRYTHDGIVIEILDDGRGAAGRRLLGMRERVRVYGGELEVGPTRDGGHAVRARLPMQEGQPA